MRSEPTWPACCTETQTPLLTGRPMAGHGTLDPGTEVGILLGQPLLSSAICCDRLLPVVTGISLLLTQASPPEVEGE